MRTQRTGHQTNNFPNKQPLILFTGILSFSCVFFLYPADAYSTTTPTHLSHFPISGDKQPLISMHDLLNSPTGIAQGRHRSKWSARAGSWLLICQTPFLSPFEIGTRTQIAVKR
jgi:hypothetical protein